MILVRRDFPELGHPKSTSYLENIERIGGPEQSTPFRALLEALEEQIQVLNTLHQADMQ